MKGKRNPGIKLLMIVLGAALILSSFVGCSPTEEKPTLILADLAWDSALFHNSVADFILENGYGYETDGIPGGTIPLFAGLAAGEIDINMEVWVDNQKKAVDEAIEAGQVIDLGPNFRDSWQGWLVPTYMVEDGLLPADISVDNISDYWELFKDPEDPSKGRFYNGDPSWECTGIDAIKFEAYGLGEHFNIFNAGSVDALNASLMSAYESREPWFGYYWSPTYLLGQIDMTVVAEPAFDQAVWDENKGCSYTEVPVHIGINTSLMEKAPEVVTFLTKYETTSAMINASLAYMDDNGVDYDAAAVWFLQEYESTWIQWVPEDIADKVKAALP